jgi:hypothetical protein
MAYNFQTGHNKTKLLTEYESVSQKVLSLIESVLHITKGSKFCMSYSISDVILLFPV